MTITYDRKMHVFQCDTCLDSLETLETNWHKAVQVMKNEGWVPIKGDNDKYTHKCAECAK